MRNTGVVWVCGLVILCGAGCGYLDDDIALSDEEFAQSFQGAQGLGSQTITIEGGSFYVSGCGIGGRGYGHGDVARARRRPRVGTSTIDLAATTITVSGSTSPSGERRAVWRGEEAERDDEPHGPVYAAGELQTWGDYFEAEMRRAGRIRASTK